MKFILLINVKMPTIVGILTFISMINTSSKRFKARNFFICRYFSFCEQLKFRDQLSMKMFYNLGAWRSGVRLAMHAASRLPEGGGATDGGSYNCMSIKNAYVDDVT